MYPILFKIGSLNFYSHGVFIVLGMAIGIAITAFVSRKKGLAGSFLFGNIIYTLLAGIIGARISYFILYPDQFNSIMQIFLIWEGGLISYGGFLFGGLAFLILLLIEKQPVLDWFDSLALGFPIGLLFGRLGDVLAGDYSNAEKFVNFSSISNGFPLPFYEAILCLFIFLAVLAVFLSDKKNKPGFIFLLTLLLYSGGRFIIDFWRDESKIFLNLSTGQLFSLIIILISFTATILLLKVRKEGDNNELNS